MSSNAQLAWDQYTDDQKIAFLQNMRADLVRQRRRQVHTSRSDGIDGAIRKVEKQLAELAKAKGTHP